MSVIFSRLQNCPGFSDDDFKEALSYMYILYFPSVRRRTSMLRGCVEFTCMYDIQPVASPEFVLRGGATLEIRPRDTQGELQGRVQQLLDD